MPIKPTCRAHVVMLMLCALSVTGCSTPLPPPAPVQQIRVPPPPAELMQPPDSGRWSESVLQLLRKWQKLLMPPAPV